MQQLRTSLSYFFNNKSSDYLLRRLRKQKLLSVHPTNIALNTLFCNLEHHFVLIVCLTIQ